MVSTLIKVKGIWKGLLRETSIHGCQYATQEHKHVVHRILWVLAVISGLSYLMYNLVNMYVTYYQYNFTTKTNVKFDDQLTFPAVTFCDRKPFDESKMNMSSGIDKYLITNNITDKSIIITPDDLKRRMFNVSQTIQYEAHTVDWKTRMTITYSFLGYEPCFTHNGQSNQDVLVSKENDPVFLQVKTVKSKNVSKGLKIFIHQPGEPVDRTTPQTYLEDGSYTTIDVSVKQYTYLPYPYNSYRHADCIDDTVNKLKHYQRYSYRGCLMECLSDLVLHQCGCVTEHLIHNASSKFCTVKERIECIDPMSRQFYFNSSKTRNCNCLQQCSDTEYTPDVTTYDNVYEEGAELLIKFKTTVVEHVLHIPEMTLPQMTSNLGGFMGFCLGASIMSIVEIGAALLQTMWTLSASIFKAKQINVAT